MSYLLDINFYNKLPIWIYISAGFGILLVLNTSCLCCYSCKYKKKLQKLKLKEFEINKREKDLERRLQREKKFDGIVLSKPMIYQDIV